jgi:hypothetical protein
MKVNVRFEGLRAAIMKKSTFQDITPYSPMKIEISEGYKVPIIRVEG